MFIGFRAYLGDPGWSHLKLLNIVTSAKTFFSKYSYSHRFWGSGLGHFFCGTTAQSLQHSRSPPLSLCITFPSWPCSFLLLPLCLDSTMWVPIEQCACAERGTYIQSWKCALGSAAEEQTSLGRKPSEGCQWACERNTQKHKSGGRWLNVSRKEISMDVLI